mgnify:CR=1 FL=1
MLFTSQCPSSNPKHAFYNKYEMEAKQIVSVLQAFKFIQEHSWLHKMEFQLNAIQPWAYIQQITRKQK